MLSSVGMTQATLYEQNEPRTTKVEELPAIQFTAATEPPKYLPPRCKHCGKINIVLDECRLFFIFSLTLESLIHRSSYKNFNVWFSYIFMMMTTTFQSRGSSAVFGE